LEFVQSLGRPSPVRKPLSESDRAAIEGRYVFGDRPRDAFVVDTDKDLLGIARVGAPRRILAHLGDLEFHPAGAPAVRIRFQLEPGPVTLNVFDPDLVVSARKR
jgi:hypothetical protein